MNENNKKILNVFIHFTITANLMIISLVLIFMSPNLNAQEIDVLLKKGHVIDPRNKINEVMDVAISEGKIYKIAVNIPSNLAKKVIDVSGKYVTPGFIDIHTHVFVGSNPGFADGFMSVSPDDITFKSGVTTVVDAGTSGWRNFPVFKSQVIDRSQTRILVFLNIAGSGMTGFPSEENVNDMDPWMTSLLIKQNKDIIVGVKIGHYRGSDWAPFDRAVEAGKLAEVPLLVECHMPFYSLEEILKRLRTGDIYTHSFCTAVDRECLLDEDGNIKQIVLDAKNKGVRFDVGHGGAMFHFSIAIPAMKQGLLPDSFGSDLHRSSMNSSMKDMLTTMSKYLNLGMPLEDVIFRASWNSALSIKRDDIGHLSEGSVADIAVLSIRKGNFGFFDTKGVKIKGDRKLEAEMTIREGKIVWDLNGLASNQEIKLRQIHEK